MPTLTQLFKQRGLTAQFRRHRLRVRGTKALFASPQRRGTCIRAEIVSPKKPNSAERKVAKLLLTTKCTIRAAIPGEGHNVQQFSSVLVRGGRVRDIPGIRYKIIRGAADISGVAQRARGRSKYGTKQWKKKTN
jgi:small subunit ribosomal protein S12